MPPLLVAHWLITQPLLLLLLSLRRVPQRIVMTMKHAAGAAIAAAVPPLHVAHWLITQPLLLLLLSL